MTEEEARALAEEAFPRLFPDLSVPCRINHTATRLVNGHWVFFWNSVEFLDRGTEDARMAGNLPIVVRASDGEVFEGDRRPLEEQFGDG